MSGAVAKTLLIGAAVLVIAACGYDTSATFSADGSVTVGMKFLLPKSLQQGTGGASVSGFSPADIAKANAELTSKYPGAKVSSVTEGDQFGVALTVPFKTEKDAFAFMTQASKLNPNGIASGSSPTIDVGNTGGLFASATHTKSGQSDIYTFKTQAQPVTPPTNGSQQLMTEDVLASIFTVTFALTVPHEITSAPGALFTLDRKTAIWKVSWTQSQTLTATTGPALSLAGAVSNPVSGPSLAALIGIGLAAIALGFFLGMIGPWRLLHGPAAIPR